MKSSRLAVVPRGPVFGAVNTEFVVWNNEDITWAFFLEDVEEDLVLTGSQI